jgi:hypothetical protein
MNNVACVLQADLQDKALHEPPRLGRHAYKPCAVQVLASDDITGSLRTLKTIPQVAKDRFNSLQKRGVIQVLDNNSICLFRRACTFENLVLCFYLLGSA